MNQYRRVVNLRSSRTIVVRVGSTHLRGQQKLSSEQGAPRSLRSGGEGAKALKVAGDSRHQTNLHRSIPSPADSRPPDRLHTTESKEYNAIRVSSQIAPVHGERRRWQLFCCEEYWRNIGE